MKQTAAQRMALTRLDADLVIPHLMWPSQSVEGLADRRCGIRPDDEAISRIRPSRSDTRGVATL